MSKNPKKPERQPVPYRPEDFALVPEELRTKWQNIVEHDVNRSTAPAITYREWRLFARLTFQQWHVRNQLVEEFSTDPAKKLPESAVTEAIDHCCGVLSDERIRDRIAIHLRRRQEMVATSALDKKNIFFRNDIEYALYMLYEPEAGRYISNYSKQHKIAGVDEDVIRERVLGALRSHAAMRYVAEHEEQWLGLLRKSLKGKLGGGHAQAVNRRRGDTGRLRRNIPMDKAFADDEGDEFGDLLGRFDDKAIRMVASAEAIIKMLKVMETRKKPGSDRPMFGEAETKVLRAYCENLLSGNEKTNSELAFELGMTPANFGASLGNLMKKIRNDPHLHRDFSNALSENEGGHRR